VDGPLPLAVATHLHGWGGEWGCFMDACSACVAVHPLVLLREMLFGLRSVVATGLSSPTVARFVLDWASFNAS
jgi:hypothetical protein